jgi:hypothetical protein
MLDWLPLARPTIADSGNATGTLAFFEHELAKLF